jgi:hypothetical protein
LAELIYFRPSLLAERFDLFGLLVVQCCEMIRSLTLRLKQFIKLGMNGLRPDAPNAE